MIKNKKLLFLSIFILNLFFLDNTVNAADSFPVDNNNASAGQTATGGTAPNGSGAASSAATSAASAISGLLNGSRSSNRSSGSGGGCESGFSEEAGVCVPSNTNLPSGTVDQIITNFMNWLLMIFSTVAVIAFLISGIQYLISTGDENMMQTAKRNMIYSIVGVLVGLCGLVVLRAITALLSANSAI